ncbi:MAG: GNAT family N-acetyltransferase [Francisellaceae bacterium]
MEDLSFTRLSQFNAENNLIVIRPYQETDFIALESIFNNKDFAWFTNAYPNCRCFIDEKLNSLKKRILIPLVLIDKHENAPFGMTSLYDIDFNHKRLEIGSSWISGEYRGSVYNALSKYILFHQLLQMGFNRLQLKTDNLNEQSKTAMNKLGLDYEGKLYSHMIVKDGRVRDSAIFSVTKARWPVIEPKIKQRIAEKLSYVLAPTKS